MNRIYLVVFIGVLAGCSAPIASIDGGSLPRDFDQDGYDSSVDCDDTNPDVFPGAPESCFDGIDNNCNGLIDTDFECLDPCALAAAEFLSYGCEFYAADLPQNALSKKYGIAVSNPSEDAVANVVISDSVGTVAAFAVGPREVGTYEDAERDHNMDGGSITDQLFRITSDLPVVAYQFNSIDTIGAASTDASLLIPTHALDNDYYAINYSSVRPRDSFISIFAVNPNTNVTVTTDETIVGPLTATLQPFEAMTLVAQDIDTTLIGTRIEADGPIGVFAGNRCANVPGGRRYCDHLEQQLFPRVAYGTNYIVGKFHERQSCDPADQVRVMADRDNTVVTVSPPVAGPWTLNAGEWREFSIFDSVQIESDKAIMVGQFMAGSNELECDTEGDPMFILLPPVEQFRTDYVFLNPPTYDTDYVDIVAPLDATVTLDGTAVVLSSEAIGSTGYSLTSVVVSDGDHSLVASAPVGVNVYGTGGPGGSSKNVSYGYPAGVKLLRINID